MAQKYAHSLFHKMDLKCIFKLMNKMRHLTIKIEDYQFVGVMIMNMRGIDNSSVLNRQNMMNMMKIDRLKEH